MPVAPKNGCMMIPVTIYFSFFLKMLQWIVIDLSKPQYFLLSSFLVIFFLFVELSYGVIWLRQRVSRRCGMCAVSQPGFVYSMMMEDGKTNHPKLCKCLFQKCMQILSTDVYKLLVLVERILGEEGDFDIFFMKYKGKT